MGFWWILRIPVFLAILVRKQDACCPRRGKGHWLGSPRSLLPQPSRSVAGEHILPRDGGWVIPALIQGLYTLGCGSGCPSLAGCLPASPRTMCPGLTWQQPHLQGGHMSSMQDTGSSQAASDLCLPHTDQFFHLCPHYSPSCGQAACPSNALC